jgi:propionyl-CoA carboxylase beta chain
LILKTQFDNLKLLFQTILRISNQLQNRKTQQKISLLKQKTIEAKLSGGEAKIKSQHERGKLTARERIELLVDDGTFQETDRFIVNQPNEFDAAKDKFLGEAVITGYGKINNKTVFLYAQDFTVLGGSLSQAVANKICKIMDLAIQNGAPVIGLIDSGGARIQEGVNSLAGYSSIFLKNTRASGVIPQISVILGPAAGGATYSPALTDFIFMVKNIGQMYITGPEVIKAVTGEQVSQEELGGAEAHASKSGVAHFINDSEEDCFNQVRKLIEFLPQNNLDEPNPENEHIDPPDRKCDKFSSIIPDDSFQPYDMLEIITEVIDNNEFMEVHQKYATNILVGFARMGGKSIGIVAQQPSRLAGVLDINASVKAARFVRFCDAFNIPIITFIDVPGFMPGTLQEHNGIIRHGAKLIYAYAEATVPKISVITRKAFGGAYIVMSSKNLKGDINYSWPTGELAVMGAEGAVNIIHRKKIKSSNNDDKVKSELIQDYEEKFMNPYVAASTGIIDDVIDPIETRTKIISGLNMLANKRDTLPPKKHGTIPL